MNYNLKCFLVFKKRQYNTHVEVKVEVYEALEGVMFLHVHQSTYQ